MTAERDFVSCEWPLPDPAHPKALFETRGLGGGGRHYTITREGRLKRHTSEEIEPYGSPRLVADVELPLHGRLRLTSRAETGSGTKAVFVARFDRGQLVWLKAEEEVGLLDDRLWRACRLLPDDFRPWGEVDKEDPSAPGGSWHDCSSGCVHFLALQDTAEAPISLDWGVCANPRSHRWGLLTFEHQGCPEARYEGEDEPARVAPPEEGK